MKVANDPPADPDALVRVAKEALRRSALEPALTILRAATELDPEHAEAWALTAATLDRQGRSPEARLAYERAIALDESNFVLALGLAQLYVRQGESGRARALALWLLTHEEGAPAVRAGAEALLRGVGGAS